MDTQTRERIDIKKKRSTREMTLRTHGKHHMIKCKKCGDTRPASDFPYHHQFICKGCLKDD